MLHSECYPNVQQYPVNLLKVSLNVGNGVRVERTIYIDRKLDLLDYTAARRLPPSNFCPKRSVACDKCADSAFEPWICCVAEACWPCRIVLLVRTYSTTQRLRERSPSNCYPKRSVACDECADSAFEPCICCVAEAHRSCRTILIVRTYLIIWQHDDSHFQSVVSYIE